MYPSPACWLASKSRSKIIRFSSQTWSKIHQNSTSKPCEIIDCFLLPIFDRFFRFWIQIWPHFGSQNHLQIVQKSFWPPTELPKSSKWRPWSHQETQKCLWEASKRSLRRPTTASERTSRQLCTNSLNFPTDSAAHSKQFTIRSLTKDSLP